MRQKKDEFVCPFCDSNVGYYYVESSRYHVNRKWDGELIDCNSDEIIYTGTKLQCIKCDEVVTSFVRHVERELCDE